MEETAALSLGLGGNILLLESGEMVSQSPHVPYSFSFTLQNHLQTLARKDGGRDVPKNTYRMEAGIRRRFYLLLLTFLSAQDYCEWPV